MSVRPGAPDSGSCPYWQLDKVLDYRRSAARCQPAMLKALRIPWVHFGLLGVRSFSIATPSLLLPRRAIKERVADTGIGCIGPHKSQAVVAYDRFGSRESNKSNYGERPTVNAAGVKVIESNIQLRLTRGTNSLDFLAYHAGSKNSVLQTKRPSWVLVFFLMLLRNLMIATHHGNALAIPAVDTELFDGNALHARAGVCGTAGTGATGKSLCPYGAVSHAALKRLMASISVSDEKKVLPSNDDTTTVKDSEGSDERFKLEIISTHGAGFMQFGALEAIIYNESTVQEPKTDALKVYNFHDSLIDARSIKMSTLHYKIASICISMKDEDGNPMQLRYINQQLRCVPRKDVSSGVTATCIDDCGRPTTCAGKPKTYPSIESPKTRLENKLKAEIINTCVASNTQKHLDRMICREDEVFRLYIRVPVCLKKAGMDYSAKSDTLSCYDDCFKSISCYGKLQESGKFSAKRAATLLDATKYALMAKFCVCDETLEGIGADYRGCQTRTRKNFKCRTWNSVTNQDDSTATHAFCRNPRKRDITIWCFTDDRDNPYDYCDPLRNMDKVLQPGEMFELHVDYSAALSRVFIQLIDNSHECGSEDATISTFITRNQANDTGKSKRGASGFHMIFNGFEVSTNPVKSKAKICVCFDHNYSTSRMKGSEHPQCSRIEHFTTHYGTIHVAGPKFLPPNKLPVTHGKVMEAITIELTGFNIGPEDEIFLLNYNSGKICTSEGLLKNFVVHLNREYDYKLLAGNVIKSKLIFALEFNAGTKHSLHEQSFYGIHTKEFKIPYPGSYFLCWRASAFKDTSQPFSMVTKLLIEGIDLLNTKEFPYDIEAPAKEQPIFALSFDAYSWRPHELRARITEVALKVSETKNCSGTTVASSTNISSWPSSSLTYNYGIVAHSLFIKPGSIDQNKTHLSICATVRYNDSPAERHLLLGYAYPATHIEYKVPGITAREFLGERQGKSFTIHFSETFNVFKNWYDLSFRKWASNFFEPKNYPKAISFWPYAEKRGILVVAYFKNYLLPMRLLAISNAPRPAACSVILQDGIPHMFLAANDPARVIKYNFTKLTGDLQHKFIEDTLHPSTKDNFKYLTDIEPIINSKGDAKYFLVVDNMASRLTILDVNLNKIWDSSSLVIPVEMLKNPTGASCLPAKANEVETFCFVTDTSNNRLLSFTVNTYDGAILLNDFYSSDGIVGGVDTTLYLPTLVKATYFQGSTLIYVVQKDYPALTLLVKNPKLKFYSETTIDNSFPVQIMSLNVLKIESAGDLMNSRLEILKRTTSGNIFQLISIAVSARITKFHYFPKKWIQVGKTVRMSPIYQNSKDTQHPSAFGINATLDAEKLKEALTLNTVTGEITIHFNDIKQNKYSLEIYGTGAVGSLTTKISFMAACQEGYHFREDECQPCPVGTYNNIDLVESNVKWWSECKACPALHSTTAEATTSSTLCQCDKGYQEKALGKGCEPCPTATWKDTISMTRCIGECPPHSHSSAVGSKNPDERRCSCSPGYYMTGSGANIECVPPLEGYFAKGGYMSKAISCPNFTKTRKRSDSSDNSASSLNSCVCMEGYQPADPSRLRDTNSMEYQLKLKLVAKNPMEFGGGKLQDSQVCIPCGPRHWKDKIASEPCEACPSNSFSEKVISTSGADCRLCEPGYFLTEDPLKPCAECLEDHFCVGSKTGNKNFTQYEGQAIPCPANAATVPPNYLNNEPRKCMCKPGYEYNGSHPGNSMVICDITGINKYKELLGNTKGLKCPSRSGTLSDGSIKIDECTCTQGSYLPANASTCKPCPKGSYCLGGRNQDTSLVDAQSCKKLDPKKTTSSIGAGTPQACLCDKGSSILSVAQPICQPCPANSYKSTVGNEICRFCNENSDTAGKIGATASMQCLCSPGYFFNGVCKPCRNPGNFCPGGLMHLASLSSLEKSWVSDTSLVRKKGLSSAQKCSKFPQSHQSDTALTVAPKSWLELKNSLSTSLAALDDVPQPPKSCPENTRIVPGFETPTNFDDCKCDRGYRLVSKNLVTMTKICKKCGPGYFKSDISDDMCTGLCKSNSTSFPGAAAQPQCFCLENFYYANYSCLPCPTGAVCIGGFVPEFAEKLKLGNAFTQIGYEAHTKPYASEGYYIHKLAEELKFPENWVFLQCPIRGACVGDNECSATMTNFLCTECKEGHTNAFLADAKCSPCPSLVTNLILLILWYLGQILVTFVLTYINVAAGYNRKSLHSVVIKIAANFITCMSVFRSLNLSSVDSPEWFSDIILATSNLFALDIRVYSISVDCLIRQFTGASHSDTMFYTTLFYAVLPIALPALATVLVKIMLSITTYSLNENIRQKYLLLQQAKNLGLITLHDQLLHDFENDRIFMIFRYIPLVGESRMKRFKKLMEDMIPVYVTMLFYIHTNITSKMLVLLDCQFMSFGKSSEGQYFLRAAMSVECSANFGGHYLKFLILGIVGFVLWGIGIPLLSFTALYLNRKRLNSEEMRLKYGFLHNGYDHSCWYWESVVFLRKLLVLLISNVIFMYGTNSSKYRIWAATILSEIFLVAHLIVQPFDERNYTKLDTLENHSMITWTLCCIMMMIIFTTKLSPQSNIIILGVIVMINVAFLAEVGYSLAIAYLDNVRRNKNFYKLPIIGPIFRTFGRWSESLRNMDAIVALDAKTSEIHLYIIRTLYQSSKLSRILFDAASLEFNYFIKVMREILVFGIISNKLDVIPGSFFDFSLRLSIAHDNLETLKMESQQSVAATADGNFSQLIKWRKKQKEKDKLAEKAADPNIMREPTGTTQAIAGCKSEQAKHSERIIGNRDDLMTLNEQKGATEAGNKMKEAHSSPSAGGINSSGNADSIKLTGDMLVYEVPNQNKGKVTLSEQELQELLCMSDAALLDKGISIGDLYIAIIKIEKRSSAAVIEQFKRYSLNYASGHEHSEHELRERNNSLQEMLMSLRGLIDIGKQSNINHERLRKILLESEAQMQLFEEQSKEIMKLEMQLNELTSNPELFEDTPEGGVEEGKLEVAKDSDETGALGEEGPHEESKKIELEEFDENQEAHKQVEGEPMVPADHSTEWLNADDLSLLDPDLLPENSKYLYEEEDK